MTARKVFGIHEVSEEKRLGLVPGAGEVVVGDGQETFVVRASALDEEIDGIEAMDEDDLVRAYDTWCVSAGARQ